MGGQHGPEYPIVIAFESKVILFIVKTPQACIKNFRLKFQNNA